MACPSVEGDYVEFVDGQFGTVGRRDIKGFYICRHPYCRGTFSRSMKLKAPDPNPKHPHDTADISLSGKHAI